MDRTAEYRSVKRIVAAGEHIEAAKALFASLQVGDVVPYANARGEYRAKVVSISARGVVKVSFTYGNGKPAVRTLDPKFAY